MSKLNIQRNSGQLEISYSWRTPAMWFLAFFSFIWNGALIFALLAGAGLFISFHLLAGVLIAWFTLTRFLNTSTITVDRQKMAITHGPVPWPFRKNKDIPARSLVQLYVAKSSVKVNDKPTYNLLAKLDTGAEVKLFKSERDKELLLNLERTIETYLDIKNDTSLDLNEQSGFEGLDLEAMRAQMEKMEPIKKWLPGSIVAQMEKAELKMEAEQRRREAGDAGGRPPYTSGGDDGRRDEAGDVTVHFPDGGPLPLPEPRTSYNFPLFRAAEGAGFTFRDEGYRVGRSAQIDFEDKHVTTGRQLELSPTGTTERTYIYAQLERDRWSYYEERRLDDDEVAALGFTGDVHPLRFDNGDERYYPRDRQAGTRYVGMRPEAVEQFIYFTTSSITQFRALRPDGRGWEVYVMESVDEGSFEE